MNGYTGVLWNMLIRGNWGGLNMLKHHYIVYLHGGSSLMVLGGYGEVIVKTQRHFLRKITEVASGQSLTPEHTCLTKEKIVA